MTDIIPRGVRNNNPLNIRHSANTWQGQSAVQEDSSFVTFTTPVMGIRAAMKTMLTYQGKYNLDTVWMIIKRWAPPNENKTDIYAKNVADVMGVGINDIIDISKNSDLLIRMIKGMITQENGNPDNFSSWIYKSEKYWYPDAVFLAAWNSLK